MFKQKTKAWTTSAENKLDPVNNGENTKRFFDKKDVADTSHTLLQTVERPLIHRQNKKFLCHLAALP